MAGFPGTPSFRRTTEHPDDLRLDVHISDGYGLTEVGAVTRDGSSPVLR